MKKVILLLLTVFFTCFCLAVSVFAAGNNCVKFTFSQLPPDGSGWISVNAYTGKLEEGDILSVTVYNGGPEEFYCFLSTREGEGWLTVGTSDFVYIEPGTSETVEIAGITADAVWYLLELREISENTVLYLQGDEKVDYASNLSPMSDLVEGKYCSGSLAEFPEEAEIVATEPPQATPSATPTPAEVQPTQTPSMTATPEATPIETEAPETQSSQTFPWKFIAGGAAVVVIAAVVVVVFVKNKKKKDSES